VTGKGIEILNSEIVAYSRKRLEAGVDAAKAIFGAKSVAEAIELQAEYVRAAFDSHVAQFSRLSQIAVETAKDAAAPISARARDVADLMQNEAA
jgi:phasin family protein